MRAGNTRAVSPLLDGVPAAISTNQERHVGVVEAVLLHVFGKLHRPIMGLDFQIVKPQLGPADPKDSQYADVNMRNGLRSVRIKAGMTIEQAGNALGMSRSGYVKIERGVRRMSDDLIRRACEVFGVSAEEIISGLAGGISQEIDPNKLADFVTQARERLGSLPALEAKNLILALISASRRPADPNTD